MAPSWTVLTVAVAVALAGCSSTVAGAPATEPIATPTSSQAQQRPAGPPVGDTVRVKLNLADSFDIHPDGTCSGRSTYAGTPTPRVSIHSNSLAATGSGA